MDGIFIRKKTNIWCVLLLLCGVFFVVLYAFLKVEESGAIGELLTFLIMGILCSLLAISSILLNHDAYIHIEENSIKAKYHWFGRLECSMDDVEFVLPQINTLTILLKNGKRHVIMGVENSWALGAAICRQSFEIEKESPDIIRQKLDHLEGTRKKEFWWMLGGIALLFGNIFLTVLLTGGRDLHEFWKLDWLLFVTMAFIELMMLIGLFCVAERCGKCLLPIEQLKYRLRGAVIASHPLPTGNGVGIYTDEYYMGRIVVCGFPNDQGVYYCVQEIVGDFELKTVHISEIYDSKDELPQDDFSALIDITSLF